MSDEIDIPASAWGIKAIFPTRPGDEIIAEIKACVKAFGTPYLWRGHTHAPPPKDGPVVYLDEIHLPSSHCGDLNLCATRRGIGEWLCGLNQSRLRADSFMDSINAFLASLTS